MLEIQKLMPEISQLYHTVPVFNFSDFHEIRIKATITLRIKDRTL